MNIIVKFLFFLFMNTIYLLMERKTFLSFFKMDILFFRKVFINAIATDRVVWKLKHRPAKS